MRKTVLAVASLTAVLQGPYASASQNADMATRRELVREMESGGSFPRGPRLNPDDQIRAFWLFRPHCYSNILGMAFNTFIRQTWGCKPPNPVCHREMAIDRQRWMERMEKDGVDYIEQLFHETDPYFKTTHPCLRPDGKPGKRLVTDPSKPDCAAELRRCARAVIETIPRDPPASFVGVQPASEVRASSYPSYTPVFREAWRKASGGSEIPPGCLGRFGPMYRTVPGFPTSRIVPDNHPILEFYRWFWSGGDGWGSYLDDVTGMVNAHFKRPVLTLYDPAARQPAARGFAGSMTHWNHWVYVYPEPYNISYITSEMKAMARGNPDRQLLMMVQGMSYRSFLAPKEKKVAEPPSWLSECPEVDYMTTPPDMAREAFWALFSRRLDGVVFYGCRCLFDCSSPQRPKTGPDEQFTNGETAAAVGDLFVRVGRPLGPLFKAVPERSSEVAVLESFAAAILAERCDMGWGGKAVDCGIIATAANLMPQVLYEEDLVSFGVPDSVKVLLLPQCEVLTAGAAAAIREFQRRGGVTLGDALLAPGIVADMDLPAFTRSGDAVRDHAAIRRSAAELAEKIAPYCSSPVYSDSQDILVSVRTYGEADYLFAINDRRTVGDYVGQWGTVLEKGLPAAGTVGLDRKKTGAVYDLVGHKAVPFVTEGDSVRLKVSLPAADGMVFMVTPRPLAPLKAEYGGGYVWVTSPDRRMMIPVRVSDEKGNEIYGVVRDGLWRRRFGDGRVRVVNLADGSAVDAVFDESAGRSVASDAADDPALKRYLDARNSAKAYDTREIPVCQSLPPSQNPSLDHELRTVHSVRVKDASVFRLPAKPTFDAVEIRLGKEKEFLRARVNGKLAAIYDPVTDGYRDFRFDASDLVDWDAENEVTFENVQGGKVLLPFTVEVVKVFY